MSSGLGGGGGGGLAGPDAGVVFLGDKDAVLVPALDLEGEVLVVPLHPLVDDFHVAGDGVARVNGGDEPEAGLGVEGLAGAPIACGVEDGDEVRVAVHEDGDGYDVGVAGVFGGARVPEDGEDFFKEVGEAVDEVSGDVEGVGSEFEAYAGVFVGEGGFGCWVIHVESLWRRALVQ